MQVVCHRHTEYEAAGFQTHDYIRLRILNGILQLIDGQLQAVRILQNSGNITENNSRVPENPEYFSHILQAFS